MQFSDYYPLMMVVAVIVGAIFSLRIFFTLWMPIDRRINRDQSFSLKRFLINDFKDKTVSIHFKSGARVDGVLLLGYASVNQAMPYPLRQMLVGQFSDGRTTYVRVDEIEFIEEQPRDSDPSNGDRAAP